MALAPVGLASVNNQYFTFGNGAMDWSITSASAVSFTNSAGGFPNVFGGAYGNASDRAFKTNIAPVTEGLASILQLKPSTYSHVDTGEPSIGFIAQDVQAVLPELVTTVCVPPAEGEEPVERLALNYSGIIPVLVHAVQEMAARIAVLEAHIKTNAPAASAIDAQGIAEGPTP